MYSYNMYYAMRSAAKLILKVLLKSISAVLLVPMTIVLALFKVLAGIYRLVVLPGSLLIVGMAAYFCYTNGFSADFFRAFLVSGLGLLVYFVLPVILPFLDNMKDAMNHFIKTPIIIRSPVKYTM